MGDLLDAMDELATARDLVNLMGMACRNIPDPDEKAMGTGCEIILERINRALALLGGIQDGNPVAAVSCS